MIRSLRHFLPLFSVLILASISASGQITIDTFAGGYISSGVPAQNALLNGPSGITRDLAGNIVFCDGELIRRIQANATIETIAGMGIPGYGGDGGPAVKALLGAPAYPKYDQRFGNQTAQIQYAGAAPFEPTGVFQINAVIPCGSASGDVPIAVSIAGISTTRTVTVSIQ